MRQNFRHKDILSILRQDGMVTVDALADQFSVTLQTIRRDLTELAEANKIERVHGGAILPSGTTNIQYEERRILNRNAKQAIARACASRIPEGSSIFLNIGTSTEAVARQLLRHKNLMVVTNNMNIAGIFSENQSGNTILTGGRLRSSDGGLVGRVAVATIRQFKFDIAVIGCSALGTDGDILDFDVEEVGASQAIIEQSRQSFLVADRSKFNRNAPARITSMARLNVIFTDADFPPDLKAKCDTWKTDVSVNK